MDDLDEVLGNHILQLGSDIGFSMYERAWSLRGIENLLMDFIEDPDFVHQLMDAICEYNLAQVETVLPLSSGSMRSTGTLRSSAVAAAQRPNISGD